MIDRRALIAGAAALACPAMAQDMRSLRAVAASRGFVFGSAVATGTSSRATTGNSATGTPSRVNFIIPAFSPAASGATNAYDNCAPLPPLAPRPGPASRSTTVTWCPSLCRKYAVVSPTTPAPITQMCIGLV